MWQSRGDDGLAQCTGETFMLLRDAFDARRNNPGPIQFSRWQVE